MGKLSITIATWDYDRVKPLMDGRVTVEGCDVNYVVVNPEECFHRAWYHQEFDVTEIGLSGYFVAISRGTERGNFGLSPYVAIPVHLSRSFRTSGIYVRTDSGIREPKDLRGKRVGVPEYQITAAVWARGLLSDEFGVKTEEMNWFQGGMDNPGRKDKWPNNLPDGFPLTIIGETKTLNDMLDAGELDAIVCPRTPRGYRHGTVKRLFDDFQAVDAAYYKRTGIFPIMHPLGVRREIYEKHPWIARNLLQAFEEAKRITQAELFETAALKIGLPFLTASAEAARAVMGDDIFPYGYKNSLPTFQAMSRYMVEQFIAVRAVDPEELFPATTMDDPKT